MKHFISNKLEFHQASVKSVFLLELVKQENPARIFMIFQSKLVNDNFDELMIEEKHRYLLSSKLDPQNSEFIESVGVA